MKLLLITYSRTRNYGGILQSYGLYKYLKLNNNDVDFIDYIPRRCNINNKKEFVDEAASKSNLWGKNSLTKWIFSLLRYPAMRRTFSSFLNFMNENATFTKPYYSIDELCLDVPEADVYITGSDQVWNSQFSTNKELDLPFYLPFVKDAKKISYASSFGRDSIPDKDREIVKNLLEQYDSISVRENSGKEILRSMGIDSEVTVDPTILCPLEVWNVIADKRVDTNYILLYQVTFNPQIYQLAKAVAAAEGKKMIIITLDSKDKRKMKKGNIKIAPAVEDWLSYIKYADGVITDSFHASVFSILFKRKFVTISGTRKEMSTRISNLLNSVSLNSKEVNSFCVEEVLNVLNQSVDWDECHNKLNSLRIESKEWLDKALAKSEL